MRVLVLGGYGGFGIRISRRLAAAGHDVYVGGRSIARARASCEGHPRLMPVAMDRNGDLGQALADLRPDVLVDAAGPFQSSADHVPRACIAAGVHYLDIADARDFVCAIPQLDDAARRAGVTVISGASSVPALSGAVVRDLAFGLDHVEAVEIALSASNKATAGASVARAILSYVGKPIRIWRQGRWTVRYGWQSLRRASFAARGEPPLTGRLVALADVPDLDLIVERLPGRPAVVFRAGTELAFQTLALWLASWPIRWHLLPGLDRFSRWLDPLQRLTAGLGSDRSAMNVRVFGSREGVAVERLWTLIASCGDGPEIPALPVPLLIEKLARNELQAGARDAGMALALGDFDAVLADLAIAQERREFPCQPSLYHRVMGQAFDDLPNAVRAMHSICRDGWASGRATVTQGRNPIARLIARLVGFPREGDHDLHVGFSVVDGCETWTRSFSGRCFHSRLSSCDARLAERFGPLSFIFDLPSDRRGLRMELRGWRIFSIPLPLALAPRSVASEWEQDGRFHFDVPIALPLIGPIVHYRGWLKLRDA